LIPAFNVYLFDLDGTLLDSAEDICGAVQQVLSEHVSAPLPFDYLKDFAGFHLDSVFTDVLPHFTRKQLDGLIQAYKTTYLGRGHLSTQIYPGVTGALETLGGRKATATTKGTPTTRAFLEQFGLLRYFDHVQGDRWLPLQAGSGRVAAVDGGARSKTGRLPVYRRLRGGHGSGTARRRAHLRGRLRLWKQPGTGEVGT
jgi:hypothetical protein